jgi:ribosomal protein S4
MWGELLIPSRKRGLRLAKQIYTYYYHNEIKMIYIAKKLNLVRKFFYSSIKHRQKYKIKRSYLKKLYSKLSVRFKFFRFYSRSSYYKSRIRDTLPIRIDIHRPLPIKKQLTNYGELLINRQRLKFFYSDYKDYQLHKVMLNIRRKKGNLFNNICEALNLRLDVLLYNCHFTHSIKSASYFLKNNIILKNGRRINKHYITLKMGDVIRWKINAIKLNKKKLFSIPSYLEINFTLGLILIAKVPTFNRTFFTFPAELDKLLEVYTP